MISSRRLAREWALKILYQSDVGKMSIEESQAAALERLRREFVQRGSRAAAGSLLEEYCLDAISAHVVDLLPIFDAALDAGIRECLARIFSAAGYWDAMNVEFTFNRQSFSALWETPRHALPIVLPSSVAALPPGVLSSAALGASERSRLLRLLTWARETVPEVAMAAFAREAQLNRPNGASFKATQEYVQGRWTLFAASMSERWVSTGQCAEKQTSDWMRVAAFTVKLVGGVNHHREALDASLQTMATGWAIDRQVSVDRNILRMATFELTHLDNVPASASINEAVELAKKYSTAESGRFVNGVLGAVIAQLRTEAPMKRFDAEASETVEETGDAEIDMDEISSEEELAHV